MKNVMKSKKVIFALVTLVATVAAVALDVELGGNVAASVTDVICQVITCQ